MMTAKQRQRKLTKSEQMARVRSKDTAPEMTLRRALWKRGLRYRVHEDLPGTPDIAFVGPKVAVFCDGCFWHGCPRCYSHPVRNSEFWEKKLRRNRERDKRVDQQLKGLGWDVIRVWEHELAEDLDAVAARIEEHVRSAR